MVQLDNTLEMYSANLVSRLSLMCIEPPVEPKLKHPLSDPTHLSHRCKQAVHRLVGKSHRVPINNFNDKDSVIFSRVECITQEAKKSEVRVPSPISSKDTEPEQTDLLHRHPSKLRLSYPIAHSIEVKLPQSYNLSKSNKSRPLTPILKTHCSRLPTKPVAVKPVQIDFLAQLPVDITLLMLKSYINPADLLNLRQVNRHYHMLCQLKQVKMRWKEFLTSKLVDAKRRGQENPIPRSSWMNMSPMSQSMGVLSPIQTAASKTRKWQVYNSPQSSISVRRGIEKSPRRSHITDNAARAASPQTPSRLRRELPPSSPKTPGSTARRSLPVHHPSKRAPSIRDIKVDCTATPDKDKGSERRKEQGFLTPSKRYADGINKVNRTPLKTLNFGTPSSTCSSRTSLSSTTSIITPDVQGRKSQFSTPTSAGSEFKVPPLPSRSRQRLKRL